MFKIVHTPSRVFKRRKEFLFKGKNVYFSKRYWTNLPSGYFYESVSNFLNDLSTTREHFRLNEVYKLGLNHLVLRFVQ